MAIEKIRVVTATRLSQEEFLLRTPLGRSISLTKPLYPHLEVRLFADNAKGLPAVYNAAIGEAACDPAILVFVHDDVYFCDFFWPTRVLEGLSVFDIIGIAGNRRRLPLQSAWNTIDAKGTWDDRNQLSGILAHGSDYPPRHLWVFGPPCQPVKLLDGLLLAASSNLLLARGVGFDERFDFHFYDMDFCRRAESREVRMGTWAISLIHMSLGSAGSSEWTKAYSIYLDKWGS
jgi:hypothetical protein